MTTTIELPARKGPLPASSIFSANDRLRQFRAQLRELIGYYLDLGQGPTQAVRSAIADLPEAANALGMS
jgi:hypothetical protein